MLVTAPCSGVSSSGRMSFIPQRIHAGPVATAKLLPIAPGWSALAVTPLPERRLASSALQSTLASLDAL